jgi:hypothetical protein
MPWAKLSVKTSDGRGLLALAMSRPTTGARTGTDPTVPAVGFVVCRYGPDGPDDRLGRAGAAGGLLDWVGDVDALGRSMRITAR